jgi:hypothetical protein
MPRSIRPVRVNHINMMLEGFDAGILCDIDLALHSCLADRLGVILAFAA